MRSLPRPAEGTSTRLRHSRRGGGPLPAWWVLSLALSWAAAATDTERAIATDRPELSIEHEVVSGETLYSLARRYGSSVEVLTEENGIADVRKLQTGTLLRIPIDSGTAVGLEVDRLIERGEAHLRNARFEAALEDADAARPLLDALPSSSQRERRVRLEIASATVHTALGDDDAALACLRRALQADSELELDPAVVSPKLMRVFRSARQPIASNP
jgi:LysM repeat protein